MAVEQQQGGRGNEGTDALEATRHDTAQGELGELGIGIGGWLARPKRQRLFFDRGSPRSVASLLDQVWRVRGRFLDFDRPVR